MKINNTSPSFGMKVPTKDIAANMLGLFIDGSKAGSTISVNKTCSALTGRPLTHSSGDTNWYLARSEVRSFVHENFPDMTAKLKAVKDGMVKKYGDNVFKVPDADQKKVLNNAVKRLERIGIGKNIDIEM